MDRKGSDGGEKEAYEKEGKRSVLLVILIGAPGSGKSTFCDQVMKATASSRTWIRICQDTIANGKSGTKIQCLKRASDALKGGNSVFIDRCNLDIDQRSEFMKLGGSSPHASISDFSVDVHGVVLDLPARVCISRSVKRSADEHSLHGGKAAAVVNKMLQNKELPKLTEGFSRITFCQNENDVRDAINTYANLGPFDSLSSGCFGQNSGDSKVQLGIMRFMKKIDPSTAARSDGNCSNDVSGTKPETTEILQPDEGPMNGSSPNKESKQDGDTVDDLSSKNIHTLAFPSISTSDFQFDNNMASDIIVEKVGDFLNKNENVRLVFVDLTHRSNIFSLVRSKAVKANIDPKKFLTVVGDITKLSTEANICCNVIANAANWRLKPGGGGVNAAIFKAAGESLEIATRKCAGTLSPGNSVTVPLPSTSPLYQGEGVTHVIHVLGPNMNPQRPSCLKNDYNKGCKILRDSYSSLFENFVSLVQNRKFINPQGDLVDRLKIPPYKDAIADLKTKRGALTEHGRIKKSRGDSEQFITRNYDSGDNSLRLESPGAVNVKEKVWGSWAQALHKIAMNPEKHQALILEETDDYVVLNDLYPKAKKHVLILAKLYGLDRLSDVRREHLPLVKKMHSAGLRLVGNFLKDDTTLIFRMGYHMVPSMRQLHLHVISQDFDSPNLKNKKHWNTFNTVFFRDSADVVEEIDNTGHAITSVNDHDKLLSTELRCHKCRSAHPNIPKLKSHISRCFSSFSESLLQNGRLISSSTLSNDQ